MRKGFWVAGLAVLIALGAAGVILYRRATAPSAPPPPLQFHARARAVLLPAAPQPTPQTPPHAAAAGLSSSLWIYFAVPAPLGDRLVVVAATRKESSGSVDPYSGAIYLLQLSDGSARPIAEGTNLVSIAAPVWSRDGGHVYFALDTGCEMDRPGASACGLFDFDVARGTRTQLTADSTLGLALSPDGSQLAFWDFTRNDQLVVLNLQSKQVVRSWGGQVHAIDDAQLSDLAFAPDGRSLLALTYGEKQANTLQAFDLASGAVRTVAALVQSLVAAANAVYYLQFEPVPFTNPEYPHALYRISSGAPEPVRVLDDFPYLALTPGGSGRWLTARMPSPAVYDTETGATQTAGKSCQLAASLADGAVLYTYGGELIRDAHVCDGPPPPQLPLE